MKDWKQLVISPESSLRDAIARINACTSIAQTLFIVDNQEKLLGAVTDGDVRRALLTGVSLHDNVTKVMNSTPQSGSPSTPPKKINDLMLKLKIDAMPIVDEDTKVQTILCLSDFSSTLKSDISVVIMAGGEGARLRPLTNDYPKPMLQIGERPLLETTIRSLAEHGFRNFYLSVNYRSDIIKKHFGNGSRWNIAIKYLEEKNTLGTAGSLHLLPQSIADTILVVNGDLLTKTNYHSLLAWHNEQNSFATVATRLYDFQIPYGVVQSEENQVQRIIEKPLHRVWVNAGIYVLNKNALGMIPAEEFFDMTTLLEKLLSEDKVVRSFPIGEYWMDIGQSSDLERAKSDFAKLFE